MIYQVSAATTLNNSTRIDHESGHGRRHGRKIAAVADFFSPGARFSWRNIPGRRAVTAAHTDGARFLIRHCFYYCYFDSDGVVCRNSGACPPSSPIRSRCNNTLIKMKGVSLPFHPGARACLAIYYERGRPAMVLVAIVQNHCV